MSNNELRFLKALGYKYYTKSSSINFIKFNNLAQISDEIKNCKMCNTSNRLVHNHINSDVLCIGYKFRSDYFDGFFDNCNKTFLIKCENGDINNCKIFLNGELEIYKPKVIITLGESVINEILRQDVNFSSIRGGLINYERYKILPTFDLDFLRKNPSKIPLFQQDLSSLLKI